MDIKNLPPGVHVSREYWLPGRAYLTVTKLDNGEYWYCEKFMPTSKLRANSSAYSANDFIIVKDKKEVKMDYAKNIIVTNSKGNIRDFENEEQALEYIQETMEDNPKLKFKIFKAYKAVEPKKIDITGFIKDLLC